MLKTELEWARRQPKARTTKAKARLDRIDEAKSEQQALRNRGKVADLRFGEAPRLGKTVLELDRVSKRFGDGPLLLDNVSFAMRKGERFGILGPNGSGKTTLLRLVTGELTPDAARAVAAGQLEEIEAPEA